MDRRTLLIAAGGVAMMIAGGTLLFVIYSPNHADALPVSDAFLPGQPVPEGFPAADDYAQQVFEDTNAARTAQGLDSLAWDDCAAGLAAERIVAILPTGKLEHPSFAPSCGDTTMAGENLGHSIYLPAQLVDAWMNSPGHRANVVNPGFATLGVACVASALDDPSAEAGPGQAVGGMLCSEIFGGYAP